MEANFPLTSRNKLEDSSQRKSKTKVKIIDSKAKIRRQNSNPVSSSGFIQEAKKTIFDPEIAEEHSYLKNFLEAKIIENQESQRSSFRFKNNYMDSLNSSKKNSANFQIKFYDMIDQESASSKEIKSEGELDKLIKTRYLGETRPIERHPNVYDSIEEEEPLEFLEEESGICILPDNNFKKVWDYIIVALTVASILETPYSLAFRENSSEMDFEFYLMFVMDILFCIDILLTFFTAYFNDDERLITNNWIIARNYLFSWFILDLFSSFPTSSIIQMFSSSDSSSKPSLASLNRLARITRPIRILKWFRIIRLAKIAQMTKKKQIHNTKLLTYIQKFKKPFKYAMKMLSLYGTFLYFLACMWVFIGKLQIQYGYHSWLMEPEFVDKGDFDLFVDSLYFNFSTILTVGYGDLTPETSFEYVYCIALLGLGTSVYSYLLSKLSTVFSQLDDKTIKYRKKLGILMNINDCYDISYDLFKQMRRAIKFDYEETFNEMNKLVETLPNNLKLNLYLEMYIKLINKLNFFKNQSYEFIVFILPLLKPVKFRRNELIVSLGEYFSEFYMITKGKASVELGENFDSYVLAYLREGHNFGDLMMYINEQSPFNFRSKAPETQLLALSREDFLNIKEHFKRNLKVAMSNSYKFLLMLEEKHYLALEYYDSVGNLEGFSNFYNEKRIKKRTKVLLETIDKDLVDDDFVRIMGNTVIDPFKKASSLTKKKLEGTKKKLELLKKRSLTNKLNIQRINTNNDKAESGSNTESASLASSVVKFTRSASHSKNNSHSNFKLPEEYRREASIEKVLPKRIRTIKSKPSLKQLEKRVFKNAGLTQEKNYLYKHDGYSFCNKCVKRNKVKNAKIISVSDETSQIKDKVKNLRENNVKEITRFTMQKQMRRLEEILDTFNQGKRFSKFVG